VGQPILVDKRVLHAYSSGLGVGNLDAHNPLGSRGVKKPAHFPAGDAQDGTDLVLGFVFFVVQLSGAHGEQLVIELVAIGDHGESLRPYQHMLEILLI
jgi:hypothetical protein